MKTKHSFNPGDIIRHNGKMGVVCERKLYRNRDTVTVEWETGDVQTGLHSRLWMCELLERAPEAVQ